MAEPSLYDRLGGVNAITQVVNRFSDEVIKNPKLNVNPQLVILVRPGWLSLPHLLSRQDEPRHACRDANERQRPNAKRYQAESA